MPQTKIGQFRIITTIEGISFLILLFIAMPLKYMMGIPLAVKIAGMTHGILFILFVYTQFMASRSEKWGIKFDILAFLLSLIPFGSFYLSNRLVKMEESK